MAIPARTQKSKGARRAGSLARIAKSLRTVEGDDTEGWEAIKPPIWGHAVSMTCRAALFTGWQNSDTAGLDVDSEFGTQDLLAAVYDAGPHRRFHAADVVGAGRDHPDLRSLLVGGVPQQLDRLALSVDYE